MDLMAECKARNLAFIGREPVLEDFSYIIETVSDAENMEPLRQQLVEKYGKGRLDLEDTLTRIKNELLICVDICHKHLGYGGRKAQITITLNNVRFEPIKAHFTTGDMWYTCFHVYHNYYIENWSTASKCLVVARAYPERIDSINAYIENLCEFELPDGRQARNIDDLKSIDRVLSRQSLEDSDLDFRCFPLVGNDKGTSRGTLKRAEKQSKRTKEPKFHKFTK